MAADSHDFGALIVELVRDRAIQECNSIATDEIDGPLPARWHAEFQDRSVLPEAVIPDVVDEVIFALLSAIDNGDIHLYWSPSQGAKPVSLTELGRWEMAGWYIADDGWRTRFSQERVNRFTTDG